MLTSYTLIIYLDAMLFLLGMFAFIAGVLILALRTASTDIKTMAVQTTRLAQKGLAEDISGLVGNASNLEAVFCVFGPRTAKSPSFCAGATALILSTMRASGPRRLICMTGAMVGEPSSNVSLPMRVMAGLYRRQCPELAADASAQERAVIDSDLAWTLVKPPRLTDDPATQRVRAGPALHVGLLTRFSRGDLAAFMLDETVAARHVRERVYVSG